MDVMKAISDRGIVPVIKITRAEDAVPLCNALAQGGLPVAEITFRTDAAEESIKRVHDQLPNILLGAGTVLTCEQADRAAKAGASFIVTPGFNPTVVRHCIDSGLLILPGCSSPSDIERALEMGLSVIKFFPAETLGGIAAINAMSAPYGSVRFVPTGGIDEKKLPAYLANEKILACGGSWMVKEAWIQAGDFQSIKQATSDAVDAMLGFSIGLAEIAAIAKGDSVTIRTHSIQRATAYLSERGISGERIRLVAR